MYANLITRGALTSLIATALAVLASALADNSGVKRVLLLESGRRGKANYEK